MSASFRKVSVEPIFDGHVVRLNRERFAAPDGTEFEREIVRHPGAVVVVPMTDDGHVIMVRQFRASFEELLLEFPAGLLDKPGEPLDIAAARELREEVGIEAGTLELLCTAYHSPGFSDERVTIFRATNLRFLDHDRQGPEEQFMEVVRMPLADAHAAVLDGRVRNASAVIGLLLAAAVPSGSA